MAILSLKFDTAGLGERLKARFQTLANPEYLLRPVAFDLIALMTQRIHDRGVASDGQLIKKGQGYSKGYMYTRAKNNRNKNDKPIVISLTRQLENDWSVIAIQGGYGIGFKNTINYNKSQWVEAMFAQKIFSLHPDEQKYAQQRFQELIAEALK